MTKTKTKLNGLIVAMLATLLALTIAITFVSFGTSTQANADQFQGIQPAYNDAARDAEIARIQGHIMNTLDSGVIESYVFGDHNALDSRINNLGFDLLDYFLGWNNDPSNASYQMAWSDILIGPALASINEAEAREYDLRDAHYEVLFFQDAVRDLDLTAINPSDITLLTASMATLENMYANLQAHQYNYLAGSFGLVNHIDNHYRDNFYQALSRYEFLNVAQAIRAELSNLFAAVPTPSDVTWAHRTAIEDIRADLEALAAGSYQEQNAYAFLTGEMAAVYYAPFLALEQALAETPEALRYAEIARLQEFINTELASEVVEDYTFSMYAALRTTIDAVINYVDQAMTDWNSANPSVIFDATYLDFSLVYVANDRFDILEATPMVLQLFIDEVLAFNPNATTVADLTVDASWNAVQTAFNFFNNVLNATSIVNPYNSLPGVTNFLATYVDPAIMARLEAVRARENMLNAADALRVQMDALVTALEPGDVVLTDRPAIDAIRFGLNALLEGTDAQQAAHAFLTSEMFEYYYEPFLALEEALRDLVRVEVVQDIEDEFNSTGLLSELYYLDADEIYANALANLNAEIARLGAIFDALEALLDGFTMAQLHATDDLPAYMYEQYTLLNKWIEALNIAQEIVQDYVLVIPALSTVAGVNATNIRANLDTPAFMDFVYYVRAARVVIDALADINPTAEQQLNIVNANSDFETILARYLELMGFQSDSISALILALEMPRAGHPEFGADRDATMARWIYETEYAREAADAILNVYPEAAIPNLARLITIEDRLEALSVLVALLRVIQDEVHAIADLDDILVLIGTNANGDNGRIAEHHQAYLAMLASPLGQRIDQLDTLLPFIPEVVQMMVNATVTTLRNTRDVQLAINDVIETLSLPLVPDLTQDPLPPFGPFAVPAIREALAALEYLLENRLDSQGQRDFLLDILVWGEAVIVTYPSSFAPLPPSFLFVYGQLVVFNNEAEFLAGVAARQQYLIYIRNHVAREEAVIEFTNWFNANFYEGFALDAQGNLVRPSTAPANARFGYRQAEWNALTALRDNMIAQIRSQGTFEGNNDYRWYLPETDFTVTFFPTHPADGTDPAGSHYFGTLWLAQLNAIENLQDIINRVNEEVEEINNLIAQLEQYNTETHQTLNMIQIRDRLRDLIAHLDYIIEEFRNDHYFMNPDFGPGHPDFDKHSPDYRPYYLNPLPEAILAGLNLEDLEIARARLIQYNILLELFDLRARRIWELDRFFENNFTREEFYREGQHHYWYDLENFFHTLRGRILNMSFAEAWSLDLVSDPDDLTSDFDTWIRQALLYVYPHPLGYERDELTGLKIPGTINFHSGTQTREEWAGLRNLRDIFIPAIELNLRDEIIRINEMIAALPAHWYGRHLNRAWQDTAIANLTTAIQEIDDAIYAWNSNPANAAHQLPMRAIFLPDNAAVNYGFPLGNPDTFWEAKHMLDDLIAERLAYAQFHAFRRLMTEFNRRFDPADYREEEWELLQNALAGYRNLVLGSDYLPWVDAFLTPFVGQPFPPAWAPFNHTPGAQNPTWMFIPSANQYMSITVNWASTFETIPNRTEAAVEAFLAEFHNRFTQDNLERRWYFEDGVYFEVHRAAQRAQLYVLRDQVISWLRDSARTDEELYDFIDALPTVLDTDLEIQRLVNVGPDEYEYQDFPLAWSDFHDILTNIDLVNQEHYADREIRIALINAAIDAMDLVNDTFAELASAIEAIELLISSWQYAPRVPGANPHPLYIDWPDTYDPMYDGDALQDARDRRDELGGDMIDERNDINDMIADLADICYCDCWFNDFTTCASTHGYTLAEIIDQLEEAIFDIIERYNEWNYDNFGPGTEPLIWLTGINWGHGINGATEVLSLVQPPINAQFAPEYLSYHVWRLAVYRATDYINYRIAELDDLLLTWDLTEEADLAAFRNAIRGIRELIAVWDREWPEFYEYVLEWCDYENDDILVRVNHDGLHPFMYKHIELATLEAHYEDLVAAAQADAIARLTIAFEERYAHIIDAVDAIIGTPTPLQAALSAMLANLRAELAVAVMNIEGFASTSSWTLATLDGYHPEAASIFSPPLVAPFPGILIWCMTQEAFISRRVMLPRWNEVDGDNHGNNMPANFMLGGIWNADALLALDFRLASPFWAPFDCIIQYEIRYLENIMDRVAPYDAEELVDLVEILHAQLAIALAAIAGWNGEEDMPSWWLTFNTPAEDYNAYAYHYEYRDILLRAMNTVEVWERQVIGQAINDAIERLEAEFARRFSQEDYLATEWAQLQGYLLDEILQIIMIRDRATALAYDPMTNDGSVWFINTNTNVRYSPGHPNVMADTVLNPNLEDRVFRPENTISVNWERFHNVYTANQIGADELDRARNALFQEFLTMFNAYFTQTDYTVADWAAMHQTQAIVNLTLIQILVFNDDRQLAINRSAPAFNVATDIPWEIFHAVLTIDERAAIQNVIDLLLALDLTANTRDELGYTAARTAFNALATMGQGEIVVSHRLNGGSYTTPTDRLQRRNAARQMLTERFAHVCVPACDATCEIEWNTIPGYLAHIQIQGGITLQDHIPSELLEDLADAADRLVLINALIAEVEALNLMIAALASQTTIAGLEAAIEAIEDRIDDWSGIPFGTEAPYVWNYEALEAQIDRLLAMMEVYAINEMIADLQTELATGMDTEDLRDAIVAIEARIAAWDGEVELADVAAYLAINMTALNAMIARLELRDEVAAINALINALAAINAVATLESAIDAINARIAAWEGNAFGNEAPYALNEAELEAQEERLQGMLNAAAAQVVINQINALPAPNALLPTHRPAVAAAYTAYNALTPAQQALVINSANLMVLVQLLADIDALVIAIDALDRPITVEDAAAIEAARQEFNRIAAILEVPGRIQLFVPNYQILLAAEVVVADYLEATRVAREAAVNLFLADFAVRFGNNDMPPFVNGVWNTLVTIRDNQVAMINQMTQAQALEFAELFAPANGRMMAFGMRLNGIPTADYLARQIALALLVAHAQEAVTGMGAKGIADLQYVLADLAAIIAHHNANNPGYQITTAMLVEFEGYRTQLQTELDRQIYSQNVTTLAQQAINNLFTELRSPLVGVLDVEAHLLAALASAQAAADTAGVITANLDWEFNPTVNTRLLVEEFVLERIYQLLNMADEERNVYAAQQAITALVTAVAATTGTTQQLLDALNAAYAPDIEALMAMPGAATHTFNFGTHADLAALRAAARARRLELEATRAVENVINMINALPNPVTLADEDAVQAARDAFDALDEDIQQPLVTNYSILEAAEARIVELNALRSAVQDVINAITALPAANALTYANRQAVQDVVDAFYALTPAQRLEVTNRAELQTRQDRMAYLVAAQAVINMINALPNPVTLAAANDVSLARAAYTLLPSDAHRALVTNIATLVAAEAEIVRLDAVGAATAAFNTGFNNRFVQANFFSGTPHNDWATLTDLASTERTRILALSTANAEALITALEAGTYDWTAFDAVQTIASRTAAAREAAVVRLTNQIQANARIQTANRNAFRQPQRAELEALIAAEEARVRGLNYAQATAYTAAPTDVWNGFLAVLTSIEWYELFNRTVEQERANAIERLEAHFNAAFTQADFRASDWTELQNLLTAQRTPINASTDIEWLQNFVASSIDWAPFHAVLTSVARYTQENTALARTAIANAIAAANNGATVADVEAARSALETALNRQHVVLVAADWAPHNGQVALFTALQDRIDYLTPSTDDGIPVAIVIGIVVGVVVLAAITFLLLWFLVFKSRKQVVYAEGQNPEGDDSEEEQPEEDTAE